MRLGGIAGQAKSTLTMKPLLLVLLAASLVANVVLVVKSRPTVPPAATGSTPVPGNSPTSSPSASGQKPPAVAINRTEGSTAAPSLVPQVWAGLATNQDLHRLVAGLRAAGYPASVLRAIVNQLLTERLAARSPNAGLPFWKRGAPTPETVAAQNALNNERLALFESLLGPDARPSAMLEPDARERRYGPLPDDKIDALAKIERDYQEMSADTWAKRKGNAVSSMDTMMQSQQLMEKEKLADIAALLTPDELAQYEMRNSTSAGRLINNLRNIDLNETEYAQLYQAQKAFDAANPMRATMDGAAYSQRQLAQLALNDQAKAVLGDARFYSYLEGADPNYAMTARDLAKYPAVTPTATYQVYQLQLELQSQMAQMSRNGPMPPEAVEAMKNTVGTYNTKLESLLGSDVAEAYRTQGMGRIFSSFRPAPKAVVPVTK